MKSKNNIIVGILGGPGSGKGTQAKRLAKKFRLNHIQTGELIRKITANDPAVKKRYERGLPQPDSLTAKLIDREISKIRSKRIILDTFPLNLKQANRLERIRQKYGIERLMIIYIQTNPKIILRRILNRDENRSDDRAEIARRRIRLYQKSLEPVIQRYRRSGELIKIDGNPPIDEVAEELFEKMNDHLL